MMVLSEEPKTMSKTTESIEHLEQIPGIGRKFCARLLEYYANEQDALDAIRAGAVGCVPGLSYKQALRFAQSYFELQEKITLDEILRTKDGKSLYEDVIKIIQQYAQTEYSKLKLHQYFPLPESKLYLIKEHQKYFEKALQFTQQYSSQLENKNFSNLFKNLDRLQQVEDLPQIRSRIILTDSKKVHRFIEEEDLQERALFEFIEFSKVTDPERFFEKYCRNFDVVIYCGTQTDKVPEFSNIIILPPRDIAVVSLIPEQIIRVFAFNKSIIQAMIKIVITLKGLKTPELLADFNADFNLKLIKTLKENTKILDEKGEILEGIDPKLDKFRDISDEFQSHISETENWINQQIQKEIGARSINIEGKQILDLMRSDLDLQQIRNYIPPEVDILIDETVHEGVEKLGDLLQLDKFDRDLLSNLIPDILEYPIEFDPIQTDELEKKISARLNTYKYGAIVEIATQLHETYQYLLKLHQVLLEFDFFYTVGKFAQDFQASIPKIESEGKGFYGEEMVNLYLQQDYLQSKSQSSSNTRKKKAKSISPTPSSQPVPITYQLGNFGLEKITHSTETSLSLLTGSNSGGKTMCILTCCQNIILAQMGFPTTGNFVFHPFDEIYYYKKSSGQLSAGAFETTLLQFVDLAQSSHSKIVFADELESITEPNAASKVLAGIFSLFLENIENYGIFVTHLAELLYQEMTQGQKEQIRIDGIEATGLDKKLQLIVDRNPKFNFIAKSTPELILTRLAKSGSKEQQSFFESILSKFE